MFETVSFHIVKPCNMSCKFCYATFQDFSLNKQLTLRESMNIVDDLKSAGVQKITFAGGEPLLYRSLKELIKYTKLLGITTSIITNGSLLTDEWLYDMKSHLDWIGISIDSLNLTTNKLIGRFPKRGGAMPNYGELLSRIKQHGYRIKVNTVVNIFNEKENLTRFMQILEVERWKVFDTLKVEGQNDEQFNSIKSSDFDGFVQLNKDCADIMVVESNDLMTASYLLIDPRGRLFENSKGKHTYSDSLLDTPIEKCLTQIDLDREKFLARGGIYKW